MKDFVKWLGVNEKIAKVVVWLLIIMIFLIVFNTALSSLGIPNYKITYENIIKINVSEVINTLISFIITLLNFYALALLVFRVKDTPKIFKYAILYIVLNWIVYSVFDQGILQFFIFAYFIAFCYLYSNKNKKYILYGIIAIIIDTVIQGIWYISKAKHINYAETSEAMRSILSIDYFIIILVIILVKEIYLKKRGEVNNAQSMELVMDRRIQKRKQIRKENRKKSS